MASDSFTDDDGTALDTHDANWSTIDATFALANCEINGNLVEPTANYKRYGGFYEGSSVDTSQILHKGVAAVSGAKGAIVRAETGRLGYSAVLMNEVGDNFTKLIIEKNGVWFADATLTGPWAIGDDHTIKITVSGTTTVTIDTWVDGEAQTQKSDSDSPVAVGHPGFYSDQNTAGVTNNRLDDWTDCAAVGGISMPLVMLQHDHFSGGIING